MGRRVGSAERIEKAALDAPWELLAHVDSTAPPTTAPTRDTALPAAVSELMQQLGPVDLARTRHLALDPGILLSAVRRLGPATRPLAPSPYRLSVVFMAAQPDGLSGLAVDQEEIAIRCAAHGIGMDLAVEDSGNLPLLGARVAQVGECDVIALSCHGMAAPPVLALEGDLGERVDATADELSTAIGTKPRLLFLSACSTAAAATDATGAPRPSMPSRDVLEASLGSEVLWPLAVDLCRRGWPAVLGWSSVVTDQGAIELGAALYRQLVQRVPLVEALAKARAAFARTPLGAEWHKARLFLGPATRSGPRPRAARSTPSQSVTRKA